MTNHPALERAREILAGWDRDADFAKVEARRRENRINEIMARPPAASAGTAWRDLGDGWEELSIPRPPGDRVIRGIASSQAINSHGNAKSPRGMTCTLPIPLRSEHNTEGDGIGSVYLFRRNAEKIYYEAVVKHSPAGDYAWQLIENGTYQCVSVGYQSSKGFEVEAVVDGVKFYKAWPCGELSLCRKGANPDVTCSIHDGRPWREYLYLVERHKAQPDIVYKVTATQ